MIDYKLIEENIKIRSYLHSNEDLEYGMKKAILMQPIYEKFKVSSEFCLSHSIHNGTRVPFLYLQFYSTSTRSVGCGYCFVRNAIMYYSNTRELIKISLADPMCYEKIIDYIRKYYDSIYN